MREQEQKLIESLRKVKMQAATRKDTPHVGDESLKLYAAERERGLEENEEFAQGGENEVVIARNAEGQPTLVKPRFITRTETGYVWNQYNKAHYSKENPPPKMVQGYRFVVFYPQFKRTPLMPTPTYKLLPTADGSNKYCHIRFSAGAPYEDVTFKIVNREWNKKRTRVKFARGTLHVNFSFKYTGYRR